MRHELSVAQATLDGLVTLSELYELFDWLRPHRRRAAAVILDQFLDLDTELACERQVACRDALSAMERARDVIESLPGSGDSRDLEVDDRAVRSNLEYERSELERDIICLREGMSGVVRRLRVPGAFEEELDAVLSVIRGHHYSAAFSDRDGTIANYAARYRSSHQPLYAAVRLGRFAISACDDFFVVTSGPLYGHGLLSLSAFPEGTVHLAGSKGREFVRADGSTGSYAMSEAGRSAIMSLDARLQELLERTEFRLLQSIGSGYQRKLGQLTVSTQDIHRSVPAELSEQFLNEVQNAVAKVDPDGSRFELDLTGFDVEITLTSDDDATRGYHKGDGVRFLVESCNLDLVQAPVLVCGDTASDLPMLRELTAAGFTTHAIFVAPTDELERDVRGAAAQAAFCSGPDVLVTALGIAGQAARSQEEERE